MSRIFALSDLHVDLAENMAWLDALSTDEYRRDVLLLAGDVSHDANRMARTFDRLAGCFARVFFVPGNHDLWVRTEDARHSIDRLWEVLALCRQKGVETEPSRSNGSDDSPWIVPLHSWYRMPQEGPDSLYVEKPGEDPHLRMWSDRRFIRWPDLHPHDSPADFMLALNRDRLANGYDSPVISFSHFLPRTELIFSTNRERQRLGGLKDPSPAFNFSRVAGCGRLALQIKTLGSTVHFYGHQHRDRCRQIDGITYISHCLGYPRERRSGRIADEKMGPRLIWEDGRGVW